MLDIGQTFKSLLAADVDWTRKVAVCANPNSALGFLRPAMQVLEYSGHGVPWLLFTCSALVATHVETQQMKLMNLLVALLLDLIVVVVIKALFQRQRPKHNKMDMLGTVSVDKFSFPSGHTTRAVMVAFYIVTQFQLSSSTSLLVFIWMAAVCVSRVLLGRHHILDVTVGGIVGYMDYILIINYFWLPIGTCKYILSPIHENFFL